MGLGWEPEVSLQQPAPLCQPCEAVTLDVNPSPSHAPIALADTRQPEAKCEPEPSHQAGAGGTGERAHLFLVLSRDYLLGRSR